MEKQIFFVRHGEYNKNGLTKKGIEETKETAYGLRERIGKEINIYHSPQKRAKQSAEVIAESFKPIKTTLIERKELDVERYGIEDVVNSINGAGIIVSHLPDFQDYFRENIDLKTSGCVCKNYLE